MTHDTSNAFTGFSPESLAFFEQLTANNTKAWFEAHRFEYEKHLLIPLKQLVSDLVGTMLTIDPDLMVIPAVDRTISRIYRDTRFSRDKSPYKTCLWITFKRQSLDWKTAPCFFFEIRADGYRYGMGFYSADKGTMDRLREEIEQKPTAFRHAVAFLESQDTFVLEGETYRRVLRPDLPEDLQLWHRRKNLYLVCNRQPDKNLFTHGLINELRCGFELLAPLYGFLWRLKGEAGRVAMDR